jgi:hypothetical protein
MRLFKIFRKRISKRYYYPLLSLALLCLLMLTSVGTGQAQPDDIYNQPTPTNSFEQAGSEAVASLASINSVSPKEIYIGIPQSLVAEDITGYPQERASLVVLGNNFPKPDNSLKNKIEVKIGTPPNIARTTNVRVSEDRRAIFASFTRDELRKLTRGTQPVRVEIAGNATNIDPQFSDQIQIEVNRPISVLTTLIVFAITALVTLLLIGIVYALARQSKRSNLPKSPKQSNTRNLNALEWLVLERQTNTFSLSRVQFVWWLTIIVFGYLFLFIGRGIIQGIWEFIPLSGFAYTFLISLVTLVTSQVTAAIRGGKGSGDVNPAWSDLVVHGGVIALERVQQVIWNLIIGITFIVILLVTYATASSLPSIPQEILVLMGISAGGYIGGKAVRKGGPHINQVVLSGEYTGYNPNLYLSISGDHFSQSGNVIVQMMFLDESKNERPETRIEVTQDLVLAQDPDPDNPGEFCRKLEVSLAQLNPPPGYQPLEWLQEFADNFMTTKVKLIIINGDGQRAVWDGTNPVPERRNTPPLQYIQ